MDTNTRLKRLRNKYRLIIMNEDTYEEVVKFKLSRWSVYTALSVIFVLLVALTTALIIFTPLKYYLPGVGLCNAKQIKEYSELKMRTDSMEQSLKLQHQYLEDLQKVLSGKVIKLDTNKLALPKVENSDD